MNGKDLRIIFMGTPEFAVASLRALCDGGYNVVGVITAPDKPAGRGRALQESDVKKAAMELGLKVLQPEKLRNEEFLAELAALKPDLGIVIAFRMLPELVWAMPKLGTFNLHASLLPQYRGAAPINHAIINGESQTGVTTFMLNNEIDKGAILAQRTEQILPADNVGTLYNRLMNIGAELVVQSVEDIASGVIKPIEQQHIDESTLKPAPKIFKDDCKIEWQAEGQNIVNFIRGLSPYPAAWTTFKVGGVETTAKIFDAEFFKDDNAPQQSTLTTDGKSYLRISSKDGWIEIKEMQLAGKKRMTTQQLLLGVRDITL